MTVKQTNTHDEQRNAEKQPTPLSKLKVNIKPLKQQRCSCCMV